MLRFDRFGAWCATATGIVGFLYSVSFVLVAQASSSAGALLSALFLFAGGLLATAALVAIYERLRDVAGGFARWFLVVGAFAALASVAHAGSMLSQAIIPATGLDPNVPSAVDPRGLFTFGVSGIGMLVVAWVMARTGRFPRGLANLGYVSGVLLIVIYLARLIVVTPTSPLILGPAALEGFIVNPLWYLWLGRELLRAPAA